MNRLDSPLGSALRRVDWIAAAAVGLLALTGIGMAWLNARSYGQELLTPSSLLVRSLTWTLLSIVVYSVTALVNWRWVRTFAWPLYAANILLLVITLIYGVDSGGNNRAIAIFGLAIQSSELSKILTLVAISTALTRADRASGGLQDLLLAGAIVVPPFLLVVAQPDLGTALVLIAALFGALYLSGVATRWIAALASLVAIGGALAWVVVLADYQKERLLAFIDPNADPAGPKYQLLRSLEAIRGGGLFGAGADGTAILTPLPVQESDFVFAALVRAFGAVGGLFVIALLAILVGRLVWHAWTSPDEFGVIFAGGMATVVLSQTLVNIGMNLGVAPITGITLPFVSYGGASAISLAFGLALVQSHRVHDGGSSPIM
ncbi:MAG: FtsW/RodA/SpoVE family cell cycle protein [Chloroflexi bacterium]|nr:FtsW/RodA/SpoVE family cell cycle protein [Chloroflexota bacterium]